MSIESILERIASALEARNLADGLGTTEGAAAPTQPARGPGRPRKPAVDLTAVTSPASTPSTLAASTPTPAAATAPAVPVATSTPAASPSEAVSKESVSNALIGLIKANRRGEVTTILAKFGAQSVSGLGEQYYAQALAEAQAALAK